MNDLGKKISRRISASIKQARREAGRRMRRIVSSPWAPYSHLCLVGDSAAWALDWDMRALSQISKKLAIPVIDSSWHRNVENQSIFYANQFILNKIEARKKNNRIGLAYYHGRPGSGEPEFDQLYQQLCDRHELIDRIQVSHSEMRAVILASGIDPQKVFQIPIGIDCSFFTPQTSESKQFYRRKYGIPSSAMVIGSFQKDGNGWGEGLEPKMIKGPDVFVDTLAQIKQSMPELFVLLSGPARGYVRNGLEQRGIPYRHIYLDDYPRIGELYQTLDVYLVTSRQEGGPKGILESMASGVPLVTTRVGQGMDLVRHGENGWMVEVEDVEGLAYYAKMALNGDYDRQSILSAGSKTAHENSYEAQIELWRAFMNGFVIG